MSADILREAAALMRSRAEAENSRGWYKVDFNEGDGYPYRPLWGVSNEAYFDPSAEEDVPWLAVEIHTGLEATAEHIASWHPTVALAVADWLEAEAGAMDAMDIFTAATATETHSFNVRGAAISVSTDVRGGLQLRADTSSPALIVARAYLGASS